MTDPFRDPKGGWWPEGSDGERNRSAPGLIGPKSEVVAIFMRHGWAWGGIDANPDFMHFAKITVGHEANPLERPVWADRLRDALDSKLSRIVIWPAPSRQVNVRFGASLGE